MHRLPFDPEPLLALFTTKEKAGSVAGDLEERFHCLCNRTGLIRASFWFWRQFLFSLWSVLIEALKPRPSQTTVSVSLPIEGVSLDVEAGDLDVIITDNCRSWNECWG